TLSSSASCISSCPTSAVNGKIDGASDAPSTCALLVLRVVCVCLFIVSRSGLRALALCLTRLCVRLIIPQNSLTQRRKDKAQLFSNRRAGIRDRESCRRQRRAARR